jgi:hypothetical protein
MRRPLLATLALMTLAWPARGADVIFGVEGATRYNSNVFMTTDAEDDVSFKGGPSIRLREDRGDLTYNVFYRPQYEAFLDLNEANAWEHLFDSDLSWRLSPTTTLSLAEQFFYAPVASLRDEQVVDATLPDFGQVTQVFGRELTRFNTASLQLSHYFSARWLGLLTVSNNYYRPDEPDPDTLTTTGQLVTKYVLRPQDRIGAGVGVTNQQFGITNDTPRTVTNFYQVFLTLDHDFSPTWTLTLQGGPTMQDPIRRDPQTLEVARFPFFLDANGTARVLQLTSCQPVEAGLYRPPCSGSFQAFGVESFFGGLATAELTGLPSDALTQRSDVEVRTSQDDELEDSSITYFADVKLEKRWDTVTASVRYDRNAATSSSVGRTTIADTVMGVVDWRPTRLWRVSVSGVWNRQTSDIARTRGVPTQLFGGFPVTLTATNNLTLTTTTVGTEAAESRALFLTSVKDTYVSDRYTASLAASRYLTKRLSAFGRSIYSYQRTKFEESGGSATSYDAFRIELGLRYEFDPIQL